MKLAAGDFIAAAVLVEEKKENVLHIREQDLDLNKLRTGVRDGKGTRKL